MAQKTCPSCGGSGFLGYDIERQQTCPGCSGRGTITVPDPIPNSTRRKPASSGSSTSGKKAKTGKRSHASEGVWSLFKPSPRVKKKPENRKPESAKTKPTGNMLPKPASEKIKAVAAFIGLIGGLIIFEESSNIGAAIAGGVIIYLVVAASIVIINNILDFAAEVIKKLAILAVLGIIILAVAYTLGPK